MLKEIADKLLHQVHSRLRNEMPQVFNRGSSFGIVAVWQEPCFPFWPSDSFPNVLSSRLPGCLFFDRRRDFIFFTELRRRSDKSI
jgi:hypothetical protein